MVHSSDLIIIRLAVTQSISSYCYPSCRFPDQHIMTSFCVLGMRPITFLDHDELEEWGNASIDSLVSHFGVPQIHEYKDSNKEVHKSVSPAVIDGEKTKEEWRNIKQVVKAQGYPRYSTSQLWGLIKQYHSDQFPNLITLATLALTHPVHTSDCERAFSAQNLVTTPLRNRLSAEHCDQLMRVMIQGETLSNFDFIDALKDWRAAKARAIFSFKLK